MFHHQSKRIDIFGQGQENQRTNQGDERGSTHNGSTPRTARVSREDHWTFLVPFSVVLGTRHAARGCVEAM